MVKGPALPPRNGDVIEQNDSVRTRKLGDVLDQLDLDRCDPGFTLVAVSPDVELLRHSVAVVRDLGEEAVGATDLVTGMKLMLQLQPRYALIDMELLADQDPKGPLGQHLEAHQDRLIVAVHKKDKRALAVLVESAAAELIFKPADPEEVRVRLTRLLRLGHPRSDELGLGPDGDEDQLEAVRPVVGCWYLDVAMASIQDHETGELRQLSQPELRALLTLLDCRGTTVSRDDLSRQVFGVDWDPRSRRLDALMARLRRKLACERHEHDYVRTDFGRGYRLEV